MAAPTEATPTETAPNETAPNQEAQNETKEDPESGQTAGNEELKKTIEPVLKKFGYKCDGSVITLITNTFDDLETFETIESHEEIYKKFVEKAKDIGLDSLANLDMDQFISLVHIVFSVISLAISWKFLWDSVQEINNATKTITRIHTELDKLRTKTIKPILECLEDASKRPISEQDYKVHCVEIESAVKLLEEWEKQVAAEKQRMQNNTMNNTISAIVMVLSMVSTFGLNAVNPSHAQQAIGFFQGSTAAAHVGVAVLAATKNMKLVKLRNDLQTLIEELQKAKQKMATYKGSAETVIDNSQYDAYSWGNEQVVEWVQGIDAEIAKKFKEVGVEGPDLLDIDGPTLDSIGINLSLFHLKKLLRKINELKK